MTTKENNKLFRFFDRFSSVTFSEDLETATICYNFFEIKNNA